MKKLILALTVFAVMFAGQAFAEDIAAKAEKEMKQFFLDNRIPLNVKFKQLEMLEKPAGLAFLKMVIIDKRSGRTQDQYVFSDGEFLYPDLITLRTNTSIKDDLIFKYSEKEDIDLSKLTLMEGSKKAKHVIVKVSDFQCPYCKKAYAFLHNEIKRRKLDVAVYMMHLPLDFHPKAVIYAKIFEAGVMIGKDFGGELYGTTEAFDAQTDEEIIEYFAGKARNPQFKKLVNSKEVEERINTQKALAKSMGISGTPHIFFDGKAVGGFKESLYDAGLDSFK